jgi:hypothetical protein
MDIYTLIEQDHKEVWQLIHQINNIPDRRHPDRVMLFRTLKESILAHNEAEEYTFYTALELYAQTRSGARAFKKEHEKGAMYLRMLEEGHLSPVEWRELFTLWQQMFFQQNHKEETELFFGAKAVLNKQQAYELAGTMESLKQQKLRPFTRWGTAMAAS